MRPGRRLRRALVLAGLLGTGPARADDVPAPPALAPPPAVPARAPAADTAHSQAWLALQERNVFGIGTGTGTPTDDYGADVLLGARLVRRQIQPIADVGWSRVFWTKQRFGVDTFRLGGKVAAGGFVTNDVWVGATVGLLLEAGWKHEAGLPLAWAATPSVTALLQGRIAGPVFLGLDTGFARALPNLKWQDGSSIYNNVRFQVGVQIGVLLGSGKRAG